MCRNCGGYGESGEKIRSGKHRPSGYHAIGRGVSHDRTETPARRACSRVRYHSGFDARYECQPSSCDDCATEILDTDCGGYRRRYSYRYRVDSGWWAGCHTSSSCLWRHAEGAVAAAVPMMPLHLCGPHTDHGPQLLFARAISLATGETLEAASPSRTTS